MSTMSQEPGPPPEGAVPESGDYVSGEGGPTMSQGGVMPGGSEMEGWKRPLTPEMNQEPEGSVEEQAENLRARIDNQ